MPWMVSVAELLVWRSHSGPCGIWIGIDIISGGQTEQEVNSGFSIEERDPLYGLVFLLLFPFPGFHGPDNIVYSRAHGH